MKYLETEITIDAPAEQVWSVLTDLDGYRDWNPFIREAGGELREGGRLDIRIHPPEGKPMRFRPSVTALLPSRELRWLGHLGIPGLFDGEHVFRIEALSGGGVRFQQSERFRGLLVPLLPRKLYDRTRQGFELMNQALKQVVEGALP
ncbi:MAG: SRPBCC domain-containing protein [Ectothiorhodospiraceae bacterium]|nr:SRPBCC domain-containing protein [Ectothiorhodospiraceae bacterium]MCH8502962.1 SRPBCC domain-containing protein [Ectothiorhodospiraceae bacterium]